MSTLEAVVGSYPPHLADWNSQIILPSDPSPLSKFHAKFWGVKEVADTKEDEGATAEDDDIDPSCYVLDIDIYGVEDKIWVRAEYIRMFNFAEEFYAKNTPKPLSPCLVITGQPGIGKSLWLWYALRRCCAQRKPVILYKTGTCWLFVEEGVFKQPASFEGRPYNTVIWTLVDAVDTLPVQFTSHGSKHFVIYTTSPTPSRWKTLHQSMKRKVCVMNPWTRAEIHRAAPFRAPGVSLTAIDAIFDELGPIPRLCFWDEDSLNEHRLNLSTALYVLRLSDLEDLPKNGANLTLDNVSLIYMLRRVGGVDSVNTDLMTITPTIASKVALGLRQLKRHELVRLFKRYNALPSTRKMSDDVFEAYCHVIFSTRIELDFVPMVRIGGQPKVREEKSPQWFSSHTEFRGSAHSKALELEGLRAIALASMASLRISPSRVIDYDSNEVAAGLHIEADAYYMPVKPNQVGVDSFILHDDHLYLLKMTASDSHSISDKLWPFLEKLRGLPPKSHWCFTFVKPPRKVLACPVPRPAELWDLKLYSAEVEVED